MAAASVMIKMNNSLNVNTMNSGQHIQNQLTRSLERILEDAHLSGELKLSGRKLKDFPKAAGKYNLSDTVIADLSRNRFCELPEDVTTFPFLETLLMYHNTLRSIPDSVRGMHSLAYLDLRSNQLSVLPREICFLPVQVLLVSNNRLCCLPDELGRMDRLTELDAACNQISHLPPRIGELKCLRSLSLRNNQLVYLPREITCLQLESLDISGNRIATLPVELRIMTSLVDLELENNPLTSPPASLCVRGLVHVFKYLETVANKDDKIRGCTNAVDGHTTLRRVAANATRHCANNFVESQKKGRYHVDSGYSTSDGLDKRWSQELPQGSIAVDNSPKWSPTMLHERTESFTIATNEQSSAPSISPGNHSVTVSSYKPGASEETQKNDNVNVNGAVQIIVSTTTAGLDKRSVSCTSSGSGNSTDNSPEGDAACENAKCDVDKKPFGNIQTYREYKEALRQQRNQESSSIYRIKEQQTPPDMSHTPNDSPAYKSQSTTASLSLLGNSQSSPVSPCQNSGPKLIVNGSESSTVTANGNAGSNIALTKNGNITGSLSTQDELIESYSHARPTGKISASTKSNSTLIYSPTHVGISVNGNHTVDIKSPTPNGKTVSGDCNLSYVKPSSPTKTSGILMHNNVPVETKKSNIVKSVNISGAAAGKNGSSSVTKPNRNVSWNRDIPAEKLSFTMRREFDKQKEETELIQQLRTILETRLKMSFPDDLAVALMDGVVLCHLANQVRARSVGSIHVPSPAVPKLTMARCRRNVDNFLEACRKIGVDEELLCSCADIVPPDDNATASTGCGPPNVSALYRTVAALLNVDHPAWSITPSPINDSSSTVKQSAVVDIKFATNTNTTANANANAIAIAIAAKHHSDNIQPTDTESYNEYFKTRGIHFPRSSVVSTIEQDQDTMCIHKSPNDLSCNANNNREPKLILQTVRDNIVCYKNNLFGTSTASNNTKKTPYNTNRNAPNSLDLFSARKYKLSNIKRSFAMSNVSKYDNVPLVGIREREECEYDSDIGKFNCKMPVDVGFLEWSSETSSATTTSDPTPVDSSENDQPNDQFTKTATATAVFNAANDVDSNNIDAEDDRMKKIVMKRIEFFENNSVIETTMTTEPGIVATIEPDTDRKIVNTLDDKLVVDNIIKNEFANNTIDKRRSMVLAIDAQEVPVNSKRLSTILCLGTFFATVVGLFWFPPSN